MEVSEGLGSDGSSGVSSWSISGCGFQGTRNEHEAWRRCFGIAFEIFVLELDGVRHRHLFGRRYTYNEAFRLFSSLLKAITVILRVCGQIWQSERIVSPDTIVHTCGRLKHHAMLPNARCKSCNSSPSSASAQSCLPFNNRFVTLSFSMM